MNTSFRYATTYILDRSHFAETFDESSKQGNTIQLYGKSIGLMLVGFSIVTFTDIFPYAGWFILVLGIVDAFSVYFRKSWWLVRQMISSEANMEVTLTIDDEGLNSKSHRVNSNIAWSDVSNIEKTKKGWLIYHNAGRNYLSAGCLSDEAIAFVNNKLSEKTISLNKHTN